MEHSLTAPDALARLEKPFASKDVKWLVAATSRDGRKGRTTADADPRAYTDRLNEVFRSQDLCHSATTSLDNQVIRRDPVFGGSYLDV